MHGCQAVVRTKLDTLASISLSVKPKTTYKLHRILDDVMLLPLSDSCFSLPSSMEQCQRDAADLDDSPNVP